MGYREAGRQTIVHEHVWILNITVPLMVLVLLISCGLWIRSCRSECTEFATKLSDGKGGEYETDTCRGRIEVADSIATCRCGAKP